MHREAETILGLVDRVEFFRLDAGRKLDPARRSEMGQFLTPPAVARLMASMFEERPQEVRLLDAGAGTGSLTAAFVEEACSWGSPPKRIVATAYEVDADLATYLESTMKLAGQMARRAGIDFEGHVRREDFIQAASSMLDGGLFSSPRQTFNAAILNPPYRKIRTESRERRLISATGIETSNLYTGFISLAIGLLDRDGEMVAISPRSFCNGPYFRPFREFLLREMEIKRVHVFEARDRAFGDDDVLQENVIVSAARRPGRSAEVVVSASNDGEDDWVSIRAVNRGEFVHPSDPDFFIHLVTDGLDQAIADRMGQLTASLGDLGIEVSTGRVVDFRVRDHLRETPDHSTVPLIYPVHLISGSVAWPRLQSRKPNAIHVCRETKELLFPQGTYVLVKRFSSKEERRRVVSAVFDPEKVCGSAVAFENHLNVYHNSGRGIPRDLALGLAAFLNSTLVDEFFRQFSGHTQVNATDLRSIKYPSRVALETLGKAVDGGVPDQDTIDQLVTEVLFPVAGPDPTKAKRRIEEALAVLQALGLPRAQQNERSALTLLALLDLKPGVPWSRASDPMRGITPMMEFFEEHYGKKYAPNSRETVRRQTVHQFIDAGFIVQNPDDPKRPTNSAKNVYQVVEAALHVFRSHGSREWESRVSEYRSAVGTLKEKYEGRRRMNKIPVKLPSGKVIGLSAGGQNPLVKAVVEEFCPRFVPGGTVLYIGDTDDKWATFDRRGLGLLGVEVDEHGKMPDVVVHHSERNWLLLIEAVTSHGPMNAKRHGELARLFRSSRAGLVYVTAFIDRRRLSKYLGEISWETEVWVAETPDHMIHFDGERFLGPYETK